MDADCKAEAPDLRICLLGRFEAAYRNEAPGGLAQARLQFLLAYLLLHRGVAISRQQLAFAFWPDTSDDQARNNLRTLLHRLREALPDSERLLAFDRHTVGWRADATISLDVADFEAALARARAAAQAGDGAAERTALSEAVAAYGGDLLPDCYDDWIAPIRERLSLAALQATERLVTLLEQAGDLHEADGHLQHLLRADPLNEAAYRRLMRLRAVNGDRTGVARAFHACESVLRRELGAAVTAETRAAYRSALEQAATAAAAPPSRPVRPRDRRSNLPRQMTSVIGREREAAHVAQLLAASRLVTLTGSAGVGKTTLALRVAADLLPAYPGGVWWVDLGAVADEAFVAQTIAAALEVREAVGRTASQSLADYLADRHLLLVLDNCEHLAGGVARLARALLQTAAQLHILITSQQPLGLTGETVWRVPSLAVPAPPQLTAGAKASPMPGSMSGAATHADAAALHALRQCDSAQLFLERAQAGLPTFALTTGNAADIAAICRRLDGIPLAIELAASRVRTLTPVQIAGRLDDLLGLLARQTGGGPARHRTLRATLDWSYALLSQHERMLLGRLAVFAGSFTLEAAEEICAGEGLRREQVLDLLAGLEDKSLVEATPAAGQVRFRLHETIRQYAAEKLAETAEAALIRVRHLEFYGRLATEIAPRLTGPESAAWLDRLDAEHDNVRAALAYSLANADHLEIGLEMIGRLLRFWTTRGHFTEGRRWAGALLAAMPATHPTPGQLAALRTAANLAYYQAAYPEARRLYEQALTAARALDDRPAIAASLRGLGTVAHGQADCKGALACYRESLALCHELGDRAGEATTLANLGLAAWQHGDSAAGRSQLEACLAHRRQLGDEVGIAYVLHLLSDIAWSEGRAGEAQSLNEESLTMRRRLGDRWGIAYSLDSLAVIAGRQGDRARARSLFAESLLLFNELGSQHGLSDVLDHLAGLLADEESHELAAKLMAAAAVLREAIGAALPPNVRPEHERQLNGIRARLRDEAFRAAWTLGRAMTTAQVVRFALELTAQPDAAN